MALTIHANNAIGYLLTAVSPGDTTIVLQEGQGAHFPAISSGEQFFVTVENRAVAGAMEIMLCTSRTLDSLSVLRAQQGTTALSFAVGVSVSNRVTAGFLNDFDTRINDATDTAESAAVAAASAVVLANSANAGLALKANIASPALTGTPTAPTAAPGTNTTQIATTAYVTAAVAAGGGGGGGGVPVDSPVFTGNPTAPTPAPGDNDTSLATTAFVTTAVATGVAGLAPLASPVFTGTPQAPTAAPGASTQQLATTAFVAAATAGLAPLESPTFTGAPAGPTAAPGTDTTQLATTAFVTAAVAAGGGGGGGGAPLNSPAFTGVPTAPTATAGTSTTQIATTAFVMNAVTTGDPNKANVISPAFTGTPTAPTAAPGTISTQIATTAFVEQAVSLKANIASPALTGTPTAPTAAQGTNTTQLATTSFVTTGLVLKANLADPSFTGTPTVPTVAAGDNSTKIASTAFVTNAVASFDVLAGILALDESDSTTAATSLLQSVSTTDGVIGFEDGELVTHPFLPTTGVVDRTYMYDSAGLVKLATHTEAKAAYFGGLTGGLYSTAGVITAFAPWGKNALWIDAGSMKPRSTNGATRTADGTLKFSPTSDTFALFEHWLPKSYNASTMTAQFIWKHAATTTNFSVTWAIQGICLADNQPYVGGIGTAVTAVDEGGTTDNAYFSPETAPMTLAGTPAKERLGKFQIFRDTDGAGVATNDDLAVDAELVGVVLYIGTNAATDD